jgi:peroxiredoxin
MDAERTEARRLMTAIRFLRATPILTFSIVLLAACNPTAASEAGTLIGSEAPALTGPDLTGTGVTDLASLRGKPTAVVFWLNTCPHCQVELPRVEAAWPGIAGEANILTVGMLNPELAADPPYESTQSFVAAAGLTLPTIDHDAREAVEDWSLEGVPAVFVLDADHIVRGVYLGEGHWAEVEEALRTLASD